MKHAWVLAAALLGCTEPATPPPATPPLAMPPPATPPPATPPPATPPPATPAQAPEAVQSEPVPTLCGDIAGASNEWPVVPDEWPLVPDKAGESPKLLARARAVRRAREADLLRCSGASSLRLIRTRGDAPGIALIFDIEQHGYTPKALTARHAQALDGVPLVFMSPMCTMAFVTIHFAVPFAPKSATLDAACVAVLKDGTRILALRPEYGLPAVKGFAGSPLLAARRAAVRKWFREHNVPLKASDPEPDFGDSDVVSVEAERSACSLFD